MLQVFSSKNNWLHWQILFKGSSQIMCPNFYLLLNHSSPQSCYATVPPDTKFSRNRKELSQSIETTDWELKRLLDETTPRNREWDSFFRASFSRMDHFVESNQMLNYQQKSHPGHETIYIGRKLFSSFFVAQPSRTLAIHMKGCWARQMWPFVLCQESEHQ
jgi:hypothetical protein